MAACPKKFQVRKYWSDYKDKDCRFRITPESNRFDALGDDIGMTFSVRGRVFGSWMAVFCRVYAEFSPRRFEVNVITKYSEDGMVTHPLTDAYSDLVSADIETAVLDFFAKEKRISREFKEWYEEEEKWYEEEENK